MIAFALVSALVGAGLAYAFRARLQALSFLTWIGWLLVGTGLPVLAGQLGFLALAESAGPAGDAAIPVLIAGLGAGLGWAAATTGLRLTVRSGG